MKSRNLSLQDVADQSRTSKNFIFRLLHHDDERYEMKLGMKNLLLVVDWLGVTLGDLDPPRQTKPTTWQDVVECLHDLEGVSAEDRELLKRLTFTAYSALHHRDSLPVRPEAA